MDFSSIFSSLGGGVFTLIAFVVVISVIVAIHEYGHYIVGRWSGIYADVFSLGFGKVLFSRVDRHGTKWQVAALPFGGYVKFRGDADAASGKDGEAMVGLSDAELRHTMHGAPLWARTATVAAGPLFNFALSILIFAGLAMSVGVEKSPLTVGEVIELPAGTGDLRAGDVLLSVEGLSLDGSEGLRTTFDALKTNSALLSYEITRDGQEMTVLGPQLQPALVSAVSPDSAAYEAGLEEGDVILSINEEPISYFGQLIPIVEASAGAPLNLMVWRAGAEMPFVLNAQRRDLPTADGGFETRWLMGISGRYAFTPLNEAVGPVEGLTLGFNATKRVITQSLSGMYHMVAGKISTCNISGPIGIAKVSGQAAQGGISDFISFIAVISTAIGLMNLFPIPVLDGGHLVFYAYEAIFRKPPNDTWVRGLMTIGLGLILSLMALGLFTDLVC
ncbi:RIP metalloprotease RseP [Falsihalocynthiibacter arcticus]|uniref:Zinc metalloprotease n=1 Tax=Falsihalocynthiibacter arcticus TaxID=1579316 RepID=A0A126V378_9RHOB|nr:RIP metalloprotease RseP [Falsihalocynthiibacter arcticus]AML52774.1 RIP metalloprotease RseP [Falsihalocynthiibacter arcticus]